MLQAFNVLRYEIGQKYDSHYDAFNPDEYGQQQSQRVKVHYIQLKLFVKLIYNYILRNFFIIFSSKFHHCLNTSTLLLF